MADIDDFIARVREVAKEQTTLGQAFDCLKVADELERRDAEIERLRAEVERLRAALAIASGMISTMPQYEHQHPESIMEMLLEEAHRGDR